MSRKGVQITVAEKLKNDADLSISANYNTGTHSNISTYSPSNQLISYGDSSAISSVNFNAGYHYKQFQTRFIFNDYSFSSLNNRITGTMKDIMFSTSYAWQVNSKLLITPKFSWKEQKPWWYNDYQYLPFRLSYDKYKTQNDRTTFNFTASYLLNHRITLTLGTEAFLDNAKYKSQGLRFYNGKESINFFNYALFGQYSMESKFANITIGGRLDKNNAFDAAFSPRLAATKTFGNFHTKLLWNFAFKAPTIQNIQYGKNNSMTPEHIESREVEIGYMLGNKFFINANLFDIKTKNVIVYYYNPVTFEEFYHNVSQTGSRGIEIDSKIQGRFYSVNLGYSFYRPSHNRVLDYAVEGRKDIYLGIPSHKITLNANLKLNKSISINSTLMYFSEKFTYAYFDLAQTDFRLKKYPAQLHWNLVLQSKDFIVKNLYLSAGVYNLLNQHHWLISPLNSGVTAFPEHGRELMLKLTYQLPQR